MAGLEYTMWGPMLGKQFVIFIDDFNMPKREKYGAQPPLELMRQMVDHGGWYDRKTLKWKKIVDVILVGAMGPPGGGRQPVTNRMMRHMHFISFTDLAEAAIKARPPPAPPPPPPRRPHRPHPATHTLHRLPCPFLICCPLKLAFTNCWQHVEHVSI